MVLEYTRPARQPARTIAYFEAQIGEA